MGGAARAISKPRQRRWLFRSQIDEEDGGSFVLILTKKTVALSFSDRRRRRWLNERDVVSFVLRSDFVLRSQMERERSRSTRGRSKKSTNRPQTKAVLERRRSTTASRRGGGSFVGEGGRSSDYVVGGGHRAGVDGG
ncbi:hypothetical protein U1Q18_029420 [Sarracenia purpurea var. burkii]